jgi:hypothetical protein
VTDPGHGSHGWPWHHHDDVLAALGRIEQKLEKIVSDQDTLNQAAATLGELAAQVLTTANAISAAQVPLDFTALSQATTDLQAAHAALTALIPAAEDAPPEG